MFKLKKTEQWQHCSVFFFAFNIPNLIEEDFVLGMSWDASAITSDNSGNEIDSYQLEICI
jgi:hypothetical protein